MAGDRYPPIADYALLSDCHCCALVSKQGSVDWQGLTHVSQIMAWLAPQGVE